MFLPIQYLANNEGLIALNRCGHPLQNMRLKILHINLYEINLRGMGTFIIVERTVITGTVGQPCLT